MTLSLADARTFARNVVLGVDDAHFSDARVDQAIKLVFQRALRATHADQSVTDITLSAGSDIVDLPSSIPGFRPQHFLGAELTGNFPELPQAIMWSDLPSVNRARALNDQTGPPEHLALRPDSKAVLWPEPDEAYTLSVTHWNELTDFTAGIWPPEDVTLNVPEGWAYEALLHGIPLVIARTADTRAPSQQDWQRFEALLFREAGDNTPDGGIWTGHPEDYI